MPPPPAAAPIVTVVPLPPSYRGGTEEYAYRVAARVSRLRPVRVLTTTVRWDPNAPMLDVGRAEVERLPAREILERPVLTSRAARHGLREAVRHAGLLHLHMPFPLVESPVVKAASRARVPSVLTYHMDAMLGGGSPGPLGRAIVHLYRRRSAVPAIAAADVVVSNSWGYAEASPVLSRFLTKVRVIRKGVDPRRLGLEKVRANPGPRPPAVAEAVAPPGRETILFVGRLVAYKGVPVLLRAFARLRARGRDAVLLIAGRGPMEGELRQLARRLGIHDRVAFLGFVPDGQLGDLYRFAGVVVVPSLGMMESSATALEEAATCGTPTVGTELPGAEESIPNDGIRGLLIPPGDDGALAEAIRRMLDAGRPRSPVPLRTWDETVEEYLALYRELGVDLPKEPDGRDPLRRIGSPEPVAADVEPEPNLPPPFWVPVPLSPFRGYRATA